METCRSDETPQAQAEEKTSRELLNALKADNELRDLLDEESREFLKDCDFEETLGYIYGLLLERGCDPDACLERIGILEPNTGTARN